MAIISNFISWYFRKRIPQLEDAMRRSGEIQHAKLGEFLKTAESTFYGKKYEFSSITGYHKFKNRVPVNFYEDLKPLIQRNMDGEQNILWPSEITWFAKSSGTTSDKSKFIPVSFETLESVHFQGGRDVLTLYCNAYPENSIFTGKGLVIGGSQRVVSHNSQSHFGDLSAVLMSNLPFWVNFLRTPDLSIALMEDWEEKLEKMARSTINEDVTNISGVPTWTLILLQKIMEMKGVKSIKEVWPNLQLYIHGGVSFTPYREQFKELVGDPSFQFMETYNASEGFFGIQDDPNSKDLLLMVNYGIFYEFIPLDEFTEGNYENAIPLDEVIPGINYAMLITNNSGLWRYVLGDTVKFTSVRPPRFTITGRTKHFINAFGEELVIENAEKALAHACSKTSASIKDYTAGPVYFNSGGSAGHEWLIEFEQHPDDFETFCRLLDEELKNQNSDYEAKRHKDIALKPPLVKKLRSGSFYEWLKDKGKLGGQHKVPRLSNDRKVIEELQKYIGH